MWGATPTMVLDLLKLRIRPGEVSSQRPTNGLQWV
jgi:hypothetical protein